MSIKLIVKYCFLLVTVTSAFILMVLLVVVMFPSGVTRGSVLGGLVIDGTILADIVFH